MIRKWREQIAHYADRAFAGNGHAYTDAANAAELEHLIGQLTVENTFLGLEHARSEGVAVSGLIQSATTQADLPPTCVSQLLGIGSATLYRHLRAKPPLGQDVSCTIGFSTSYWRCPHMAIAASPRGCTEKGLPSITNGAFA